MTGAAAVERPAKMRKTDPEAPATKEAVGNSVIVQFQSVDGQTTGHQLDLPQGVTPEQLETLLNELLHNDEKLPYGFYIDDAEVTGPLGEHLRKAGASIEHAVSVVYQPRALFWVRPVTRCSASIAGHSESVLCVSFSPCGNRLASGGGDSTVRFWDVHTQTLKHTGQKHKTWVLCVSFSPDGQYLVSGDKEGALWLWDPSSGQALRQCRGHGKWVTSIAWEPAHRALPSERFCSGSRDNSVKVWDAENGVCLFSMGNHTHLVSAVRWGGAGLIYSASRDTTIHVWDDTCGKLVRVLKGHAHWVNALALSSEHALRTGAYNHKGQKPSDAEEAKQAALERYNELTGSAPERLVSGSDDFTMFLWSPTTDKKPLARMTGHVQLINDVRFSPDGRWIASASFDKSVKLWNGMTGTFAATFRAHVGPVYQIAWSADSRLVMSASKDSTLKVWDLKTRKLKFDLPGHADEVYCVDWAPNGQRAASGGKDRVMKLWHH